MTKRWDRPGEHERQSEALKLAWKKNRKRWAKGIKDAHPAGSESRIRHSKTIRKKVRQDPWYMSARIAKTLSHMEKTRVEANLEIILKLLKMPYKYVGNGKLMIGRYCPDFFRRKGMAVVELNGSHYRRDMNKYKRRIKFIENQGYRVLLIDGKEMYDLVSLVGKLREFDDAVKISVKRELSNRKDSR